MSHDSARRVVITGIGLVSPLGSSPEAFWQALSEGRSGIGDVEHMDLRPYQTRQGGAVRNFNPRQFIADPKALKLMTRSVRLGVAAAELAIKHSGIDVAQLEPFRIACFVGSPGHAGDREELLGALAMSTVNGNLDLATFGAEGIPTINPLWLLKSLANIVLYFVSLKLGAQGVNGNICMSGAGGAMAIGEGYRAIRNGRADIAVAGGYESLLEEERLESFEPSGLVYSGNGDGKGASRPFDRQRRGFVPAEGAAFLVMEEASAAARRGAKVFGEVSGYGVANPGLPGPPAESSEAFLNSMRAALADARRDPWELDAIFAQGLSTEHSDRVEAEAIKQLLTARAAYVPVSALKSMTGNLVAGSGPLEIAGACGCLQQATGVPPILNCEDPDPDLGLAYVRGKAQPGSYRRIMVNAGSLAGTVASVVVEQANAE